MTMENDLVERLLGHVADFEDDLRQTIAAKILPDRAAYGENQEVPVSLLSAVASRIQALGAELARKTEALEFYRDAWEPSFTWLAAEAHGMSANDALLADKGSIARSALEKKTDV